MKLNEHFVKHTVNGETMLIPVDGAKFHGLVQGNQTVGIILECLEKDTDEAEIIDTLCSRFSGNRKIIASDVSNILTRLKAIGAIDE